MTKAVRIKNLQDPNGPQNSMAMCNDLCKNSDNKAVMIDQEKLLNILKSMSIILEDHSSIVHPDQIEEIISTLKTPGVAPAKSTRASKKERVWALLPDLGVAEQKPEKRS